MEGISIKRVLKRDETEQIEALANEIWREAYDGIIDADQIEYMLKSFQTKEKIYDAIKLEGSMYYISYLYDEPCGYCGVKKDEYDRSIIIIDLYIKKEHRRKTIATNMLKHILVSIGDDRFKVLSLNINKNNDDVINACKSMGFVCVNSLKTDIGCGFLLDDYKMVKKI